MPDLERRAISGVQTEGRTLAGLAAVFNNAAHPIPASNKSDI